MTPEVSVIIPCYNAEDTITHTLDSLKNQSYQNYTVVLVNDGSRDNTKAVIERYVRQHPEMDIRLTNCENGGVSKARNTALDQCDTEYIAFLDADDLYHPEFLSTLVWIMKTGKSDIAMGRYCRNEFSVKEIEFAPKKKTPEKLLDMYFCKRLEKLNFGGSVYRRNIIEENGLRFSVGVKYGEDSEFFCKYLYHCKAAAFVDAELYCYVDRASSAQHSVSYDKTQNIKGFQEVKKYWGDRATANFDYIIARTIWSCLKDFAVGDRKFYEKFRKEYDVKSAMKLLIKTEKEIIVKYSAIVYLINPSIYRVLVGAAGRHMG